MKVRMLMNHSVITAQVTGILSAGDLMVLDLLPTSWIGQGD
jgi:hypothetical protein